MIKYLITGLFISTASLHASSSASSSDLEAIKEEVKIDSRGCFYRLYGLEVFAQTPTGTPITEIKENRFVITGSDDKKRVSVQTKSGVIVGREIQAIGQNRRAGAYGQLVATPDAIKKQFTQHCIAGGKDFQATEIAAGDGTLAWQIYTQGYKGNYTVNDADPLHLLSAFCALPKNPGIVLSDNLDHIAAIPDNSQDSIGCFHLFHYKTGKEIDQFLTHTYRALKPGGQAYLTALTWEAGCFREFYDFLKSKVESKKGEWPTEVDEKVMKIVAGLRLKKYTLKDNTLASGFNPREFPFDQPFIHPLAAESLQAACRRAGLTIVAQQFFPTTDDPDLMSGELVRIYTEDVVQRRERNSPPPTPQKVKQLNDEIADFERRIKGKDSGLQANFDRYNRATIGFVVKKLDSTSGLSIQASSNSSSSSSS